MRAEYARDWEGTQLQEYVQPAKPSKNEGIGALEELARHPDDKSGRVLITTEHCVVAYDIFPKGRVHLLILPRAELSGPSDLRHEHQSLIVHMLELATWLSGQLRAQIPELAPLRCGFHAVPTMRRLHLHLVSIDHDSQQLKRKRHWISFNSDFLVPPMKWARQLAEHGRVIVHPAREEAKLKAEMRCPVTGKVLESMEALGKHLESNEYKFLISQVSRDILFIADDNSPEGTQSDQLRPSGCLTPAAGANPCGLVQVAWDMVHVP